MFDIRAALRRWSLWLVGIGTAMLAFFTFLPDTALELWNMLPAEFQARVPKIYGVDVGFALLVLGKLAMLVKQKWVAERIRAFCTWFKTMVADKAGAVVRKTALGLGAAGCVMTMSTYGYGQYERLEGNKLVAYADPATKGDPWTICAGATGKIYYDGLVVTVRKGLVLTSAQCKQVNDHILEVTRAGLNRCITRRLSQSQSDGLTLFAINIGTGGTCNGSVGRYVNAGDFASAEKVMWLYSCAPSTNPKYPHAHCGPAKRQMPGLLSRRKFEGSLMTAGDVFNRPAADLLAIANHKALGDAK